MDFNKYQKLALITANPDVVADKIKLLCNGVMGLSGETGEVADIVKKYLFQGHGLKVEKIKDELGDILWYIAITAHALDIPLEEIAEFNIDKLKKRFPDGFSVDKSLNRE